MRTVCRTAERPRIPDEVSARISTSAAGGCSDGGRASEAGAASTPPGLASGGTAGIAASTDHPCSSFNVKKQKKAANIAVLELDKSSSGFTDYFVICSGRSDRQVQSVAQGIEEQLGQAGISPLSIEGANRGHWVLMDFSDVIVHVFYEPVRRFYDLAGLWGDAPRVELPEPYASLAHQFRIRDEQHP